MWVKVGTVQQGASKIRASQLGVSEACLAKIATCDRDAPQIRTVEIRLLQIAVVQCDPLRPGAEEGRKVHAAPLEADIPQHRIREIDTGHPALDELRSHDRSTGPLHVGQITGDQTHIAKLGIAPVGLTQNASFEQAGIERYSREIVPDKINVRH